MPYIKQEAREEILDGERSPTTPGELNYLITLECLAYLDDFEENYSTLNEIIGVLECAKQEFYRRMVAVYESRKIRENGDVYLKDRA